MVIPVLIASGSALLVFLSGLFSLLTPLPFSVIFCRRGGRAATVAAVVAAFVLGLVYLLPVSWLKFLPGYAFYPSLDLHKVRALVLLTFIGYAWLGLSISWVGRRGLGWGKGISLAVGSVLLLTVILFTGIDLAFPGHLLTEFRGALEVMVGRVVEMNPQFSSEDGELLAHSVTAVLWKLFPSLWIGMTLVTGALNLLFARRWLPGLLCQTWGEFSEWRLVETVIWFPLSAGALYFASRYLFRWEPISWVALNLIIVAGVVYFFQGAAVLVFWLKRYVSPFLRLAAWFVFFMFFQVVAVMLVLVGLFDFWFDFRKLKK